MAKRDLHLSRPPGPETTLPFCVRTLGRVRGSPYHTTLGTFHDDAMLTVFLGGRGRYLRRGHSVTVGPGMIGMVLPGVSEQVGILMAEVDDPYDHIYCRFAGAVALQMAGRIASALGGPGFYRHAMWEEVAAVLTRALGWGGERHREDVERMRRRDAALAEALAVLSGDAETGVPPPTVDRLLGYINDHLDEPTDLDAMALHFGYSKSHLCKLGKRALGVTLQRASESAKIERATALLTQPTLSIAEIARRVGYNDPAYFSNVFLRATGLRPSAHRRALH